MDGRGRTAAGFKKNNNGRPDALLDPNKLLVIVQQRRCDESKKTTRQRCALGDCVGRKEKNRALRKCCFHMHSVSRSNM